MNNYSKKTIKEIRRLAGIAHQIHIFHNKTSREIFKRYNSYDMEDYFVAIAIANGIIDKEEMDLKAYQELELLIERVKDSDYF